MKEKFNSPQLDYLRKHYIDSLRIAMQQLRDTADSCLKKIDDEGITGYYSTNSDIHRYGANAWRASWALGELKRLNDNISEEIDKTVKKQVDDILEKTKPIEEPQTEEQIGEDECKLET